MTVETGGLVEQSKNNITTTVKHVNNRVRYGNKTEKKNRSYKKMRREVVFPRVPDVLQQLFVSCTQIFRGPGFVPPASDVNKLCDILDKMKPEDVGLSKSLQFFKPTGAVKGTPRVTYTTIYQCDQFSLCIFFLPETAVIPLHNHPEMTVFSKLLLGKMHIKSYDWVEPKDSIPPSKCEISIFFKSPNRIHSFIFDVIIIGLFFSLVVAVRLARLKANSVYTAPCNTSVLYPTTGGNMHQFTAVTPCAVLDVLGPPYSKEDDRDCSYYKDFPYSAFSNEGETTRVSEEEREGLGWLEEIEAPENAVMDRIDYLGPQIIETSY
ncbi:plant cysteine oxidase 2-like isoform X1 [Gossypium arboreum]|uniref:plant cysteine oxidase 2-like isoform X1 n=1 Tax=Gossypium arboreum TaxID=29729 RepID=UPI0022F1DABA|nr:plant cysteine oxidase 2-like isoform X1 [Gossypium arboreum]